MPLATPRVSSALKAVNIRQVPPPMIIGERLNTQGSRKAKEMVLNNDFDGLVDLARDQVEGGAHCLDVCVATTERSDEKEFMLKLVKMLSLEIEAPLVIDSTDPAVIEAAVRQIPGRPIINSINLEGDGSRFERLAPVMSRYGMPAIALCIGPNGMAKSVDEKVGTAELLHRTGLKYGLVPEQFIFDVLTFTLATGQKEFQGAGINTLEGIKRVKERFPSSFTTLGLSNISFGLVPHARKILNSVFLYHAVKYGLDTAIVNSKEIIPYGQIGQNERTLAENLIFNTTADALSDLITYFEKADTARHSTVERAKVDPTWPAGKRVNFRIINRLKDGMENDIVMAIAEELSMEGAVRKDQRYVLDKPRKDTHDGAIATLNNHLLPAMKDVGDKFGAGELILPFVLKSAECMKAAVAELEKYLVKKDGTAKGKLVLGTVYGDVHDIGKNLVKTIFENNGYAVYDLGKQVPLQKFLDKIEEVDADAVGLSALLVATSRQMQFFVEHAKKNKMTIPILCGGAAINTNYINRIAREGGIYGSGVFYCGTMFDGLKTMDKLMSEQKPLFVESWKKRVSEWRDVAAAMAPKSDLPRSSIVPVSPPHVSRTGVQVRLDSSQINADDIWGMVNKKSLFKLAWGLHGRVSADEVKEHEILFEQWKVRIRDECLFEPAAVYGYFGCHSHGNRLAVDNPAGGQTAFEFPRSAKPKHLCLADYFGEEDIVAFQAVTSGGKVSLIIDKWNAEGKYADAYYLHGLATEFAEGLAAWINERIKGEMGIAGRGGLRYSWGYPSCPDVGQHKMVWDLLNPEKSGMTLTDAGQIVPEQSTAAIIVHHPDAEYFVL